MPILDVLIVGPIAAEFHAGLARRIADAAGVALGSRPRGTWVTVRRIESEAYAENEQETDAGDLLPVIVTVLHREVPPDERRRAEVRALTRAVAVACGRPEEQVHLAYEPAGRGRLAFGGELMD
jgi:phenylpyruvate tautomerase PptA (4-oxalocrotonate tautomerase family)